MGPTERDMDLAALGRTLQAARKARTLTVGGLSERAKVSAGLISQLERGLGNPSFLTMSRLAEALEVPLGHFLQGAGPPRRRVVRARERRKLVLPGDHAEELVYELLTPDLGGALEVLRTTVPAGWTNVDRPFSHRGEECVHLLEGTLQVSLGEESYTLAEGDSITYDASVPHWWRNGTERDALIIGSVTPPSF